MGRNNAKTQSKTGESRSKGKRAPRKLMPMKSAGNQNRPKSAEMTPGPGFRICQNITRPPAKLINEYRKFESADISDMLNRIYTMSGELRNLANNAPLVGPAVTVKVFPGDNLMVHKALDLIKPGDVIVVDTSGSRSNAVLGDLIANKAKHLGAAGFIIDGLIRDVDGVSEAGLPVYARGVTPFGPLHRGPGEVNYPVSCGGIVVNPGDIVAADSTGIAVVRKEFAAQIAIQLGMHKTRMEAYVRDVKRGVFSNQWVDNQLNDDNCLYE